ncbi:MAG: hypothetical protein QW594_02215 [Candidatus Woesearchaeota archaeon]
MDERIKQIVQYIIKHKDEYSEKAIRQSLKTSGFSEQEIEQGFKEYRLGGLHHSFFDKEHFVKDRPKQKKKQLGLISLANAFIPFFGFYVAYQNSKKIIREDHEGAELAFIAMIINAALSLLLLLIILRLIIYKGL